MVSNSRKVQLLNECYKERFGRTWRKEFDVIVDMVASKSSVLDLGCGDGSLGAELIKRKNCKVVGIDISKTAVKYAKMKGIDAQVGNIEEPLDFDDNSFDYVILCDVLEHLLDPMFTLKEAFRVSKKYVIVAFPNFAYFPARLELLLRGIFPRYPLFGYEWYNSHHIRLFLYKDFKNALKKLNFNIKIIKEVHISSSIIPNFLTKLFPNLFARICILKMEKYKFNPNLVKNYKFDI